jgi:hypothetical protein
MKTLKGGQKLDWQKHLNISSDEHNICPFTLEPFEDCSAIIINDYKDICPFTFESCLQLIIFKH